MNTSDPEFIKTEILKILNKIAPEIDPDTVDPQNEITYEFEIDSMDFLRMVVKIDEVFGIEIPEAEYGEITTLEKLLTYLAKSN